MLPSAASLFLVLLAVAVAEDAPKSGKRVSHRPSRPSGLYYESHEKAQTVMARSLSPRERRHLQHEMLHLLGLNRQPRPHHKLLRTSSAPSFLLHVYKAIQQPLDDDDGAQEDEEDEEQYQSDQSSAPNVTSIDDSDLIMSFPNHGHGPWWSGARSLRHEGERRLWFDVSQVPADEDILQAEVRVYKEARKKPRSDPDDPDDKDAPELEVRLHQLVPGKMPQELQTKLIATVNATWDLDMWLLLDVTSAMREWVTLPMSNLGLLLELVRSGDMEVNPSAAGLIGLQGPEPHKPFMVAYFRSRNNEPIAMESEEDARGLEPSPPLLRRTRSARGPRRRHDVSYPESMHNPYSEFANVDHKRLCQRKMMYINFKQLRWEDWIIAPDGYKAYYCEGECSFPLHAHLNATNHAIVQTLVHLMQPYKVPKPCCAPTNLSPISVLYFDDNSNVILKKYPNMVVRSCGCH